MNERWVWSRPCRSSAWGNPKRLLKRSFLFPPTKPLSLRALPISSTEAQPPNNFHASGTTVRCGGYIPIGFPGIVVLIGNARPGNLGSEGSVIDHVAFR